MPKKASHPMKMPLLNWYLIKNVIAIRELVAAKLKFGQKS